MSVEEILTEISSLPNVGGCLLYGGGDKPIARNMPYPLTGSEDALLSEKVQELIQQLLGGEKDFLTVDFAERWTRLMVSRQADLMCFVLLDREADPYLVKLQADLAMSALAKDKGIQKILSRKNTIMLAMGKKVHVWDVVKFNERLDKEGIARGIIISRTPYDDNVRDKLVELENRVRIVVSDKLKEEHKRVAERIRAKGYEVKDVELSEDRWL